jgi:hypothetical protein
MVGLGPTIHVFTSGLNAEINSEAAAALIEPQALIAVAALAASAAKQFNAHGKTVNDGTSRPCN